MIGVLGATGRVGRLVAGGLADAGTEARALVRDPASAALPLPAVRADLADPGSLSAALDGVERLFLLVPHSDDHVRLEANAIDAAAAAGVRHVVKLSGGPATLGPSGITATATAHWHGEQRLERSGVDFTLLRPSFFAQNLLDQIAPVVATRGVLLAPFGHAPIAMVDARDVAASAVAALLEPAPTGQAWHLTGPRPATFDGIAAHLGVRYVAISPKVAGRALARGGASAPEVEHATRMAAFFSSGADSTPTDHVLRLTGTPPRPVEALLDEHAGAFRPTTRLARTLAHLPTKGRRSW